MGGQDHRFAWLQQSQQYFIKIFAIKDVIARERLIHQDIVRPLRECQQHLELILLSCRELPDRAVCRQLEELHQRVEAFFLESPKMLLIERLVPLGIQRREKRVLAGRERDAADIAPVDLFAVQRDLPAVLEEAQDRLHQRGLARAIFSEQADDLPLRETEADILQRGLVSVFFRDMF